MLRRLGLLEFQLLVTRTALHPGRAVIPAGELRMVVDSGVQKWAWFSCPGGCGTQISLSLNPTRRPRWEVAYDFWGRPTVTPSVHQHQLCKCHFWIRSGKVEWVPANLQTR